VDEPDASPAPVEPARSTRWTRLLLLGAALVVALVLGRQWPKEQTVHYVLGESAPRVVELDARYASAGEGEDWTREASFRYAVGLAPRVVTHEPSLPDGDYTVEIDVVGDKDRSRVRRRVTLTGGGSTSIDLAGTMPR
jgi:hypothetical protein